MSKKIEDLTFIDDGMFQAVMHEPGICEKLVEKLLHVNVKKIVYPELEKPIKPFYSTKGVRLDVYLKDEDKIIDVGFGLPCYTFKNTCMENHVVSLDDKSIKVIYNASAYDAVDDKDVRDFLHFVMTNDPGENDFNKLISDTVAKLKDNDEFRSDYAAMNLHDRDIKKAAKEEGIQQQAIESAKNLLREGDFPEKVARCIGLPLEKVLELQKLISVKA